MALKTERTPAESDQVKQVKAKNRKQEVRLRAADVERQAPRLSGFENVAEKRLILADQALRKSGLSSLVSVLPFFLSLKGRPYTLDDYFPFEPIFRTRLPRSSVIKSGRQVAKSSSFASQGIVFSNSVPYFSTLYVTPLFEQVQRFSSQYIGQFVETSPVKKLFVGQKTVQRVLQRSFLNGATMYFSFAFLDAERTRGIPADANYIDESIRIGTTVETLAGPRAIETLKPGEPIWSFDEGGYLVQDEVETCSDHGIRDCYRFEFSDGSAVELTSDSFLATTAGWKRAQTVIREAYAAAVNGIPNTNCTWDDAGRRESIVPRQTSRASCLSQQSRLETESLQLPKIPGIIRVRRHASQESEEQRLREMEQSLADIELSGFTSYRFLVLPERQEADKPEMARSTDLGGDRMVVDGRRQFDRPQRGVQHALLLETGSQTAGQLVNVERSSGQSVQGSQQAQRQALLDCTALSRRDVQLDREDQALRRREHELQVSAPCSGLAAYVPLVPAGVFSLGPRTFSVQAHENSAVLRCEGLSAGGAQASQREVDATTWEAGNQEHTTTRELSQRPGSQSRTSTRESCTSPGGQSGPLPQLQASVEGATYRTATAATDRLRDVSTTFRDQNSGESTLLLYDMQESGLRSLKEGSRLKEAELIRITWTGKHRVFDIATKKHQTFFAGCTAVHNCQDINYDFLSIIHETLSGSPWALKRYAGTPKSLDGPLEILWQDSSQAEFAIRCHNAGCRYWNIPAYSHDLLDMIDDRPREVSEEAPGIICAKCRRPVNPRRFGRWTHGIDSRRWDFAGYHIPQIIMPMHYADPDKWSILVGKMQGKGQTTFTTFLNEVCGESCDEGSKLVTVSDLKAAACLKWKRDWDEAVKQRSSYTHVIVSVDWGGGGGRVSKDPKNKKDANKRLRTSYTSLAVLGMTPHGKIDCLWGHRSLKTHDFEYEAQLILDTVKRFRATHIVHDYGGAGAAREVLLRLAGFPYARLVPVAYHPTARHNFMQLHRATEDHPRDWYSLDKSRSLVITCQALKYGLLRFFEYDYNGADDPGLLHDFLALMEEKIDSLTSTDVYRITRHPNMPDDFAQAVNIGCAFLWRLTNSWPDLAAAARFAIPDDVLEMLHPTKVNWDDIR